MLEQFLCDEFATFSAAITELHNEKKQLKEEFQRYQESFKQNLAALNDKASDLIKDFEAWKATAAEAKKKG